MNKVSLSLNRFLGEAFMQFVIEISFPLHKVFNIKQTFLKMFWTEFDLMEVLNLATFVLIERDKKNKK